MAVLHAVATTAPPPTTHILGLCVKCDLWFDCDTWFDRSLPTPCCPACGLGPAAIRYARSGLAGQPPVTSELWIG